MGLEVEPVKGGCCGLAGSWGFEKGKYDISMACGEQALLPAVREADETTAVLADGFSCQTQISQADVGRQALHLGELMALARSNGSGALAPKPESISPTERPAPPLGRRVVRTAGPLAAGAAVASAGVAALVRWRLDT